MIPLLYNQIFSGRYIDPFFCVGVSISRMLTVRCKSVGDDEKHIMEQPGVISRFPLQMWLFQINL